MRLDFSEVKESKNSEEGQHTLTIFKAQEKLSNNGTRMLVLDMRDEVEGYVRDHVCLEGPAAFRAKQLFEALGISTEDAAVMDAGELVGLSVAADVVIEEHEDKLYSKVKKYIA
jgi:hypothetical protein